jgi:hypothetical protein
VNLLVDAGLLRVVRTRRVRVAQIPRSGDQVYGFVAGLYPTDAPALPDAEIDPADFTVTGAGTGS